MEFCLLSFGDSKKKLPKADFKALRKHWVCTERLPISHQGFLRGMSFLQILCSSSLKTLTPQVSSISHTHARNTPTLPHTHTPATTISGVKSDGRIKNRKERFITALIARWCLYYLLVLPFFKCLSFLAYWKLMMGPCRDHVK